MNRFAIGNRMVGTGEPLFVIAEIGLNHGGSLDHALALVDGAAAAGASAVKVQVLVGAELVAAECPPPDHVPVQSLRDFFATFELEEASYAAIAARARMRGLAFIGTPFSPSAVALLARVGVDAYKIASGDLTYDDLIVRCARTGKPLVISTGMSNWREVTRAVDCASTAGATDIALLHCVSAYPVPRGSENLGAITTLSALGRPVGLSDHAPDILGVPVAVALGACLYERHITLAGERPGVDDAVSSTPGEFAAIINLAAETQASLGSGDKMCQPAEAGNRVVSRRSLRASRDLSAGDVLTAADIVALRPAMGLSPVYARELIGTTLRRDIAAGTAFLPGDLPGIQGVHEAA